MDKNIACRLPNPNANCPHLSRQATILRQVEHAAQQYVHARQYRTGLPPPFTLIQDDPAVLAGAPPPHQPPSTAAAQRRLTVPVRIDVESDGIKLREAFLLRLPEEQSQLELADTGARWGNRLCAEYGLPLAVFSPLLASAISDQLQDYSVFANAVSGDIPSAFRSVLGTIKLDILSGGGVRRQHYQDVLKINLGERFDGVVDIVKCIVGELQLFGEFEAAIVFCVWEQMYHLQRALVAAGWTPQTQADIDVHVLAANDPELASRIATTSGSIAMGDIACSVQELSPTEAERLEVVGEREGRRKRRQQTKGSSRRDDWSLGSPQKLHLSPVPPPHSQTANITDDNRSEETISDKVGNEDEDEDDEVYRGGAERISGRRSHHHSDAGKVRGRRRGRPRGRK